MTHKENTMSPKGLITTTESSFRPILEQSGQTVVLFGMPGCAPCNMMKSMLDKLAQHPHSEDHNITFLYVDAADAIQVFHDYGVRNAPTLMAFDLGVKVGRELLGGHTRSSVINWINTSFEREGE